MFEQKRSTGSHNIASMGSDVYSRQILLELAFESKQLSGVFTLRSTNRCRGVRKACSNLSRHAQNPRLDFIRVSNSRY